MSMETDNGVEFTPTTALVAPHSLGQKLNSWVRLLGRSLKKELWVHVAQLPLGGLSMAVPASRMQAQPQGTSKGRSCLYTGWEAILVISRPWSSSFVLLGWVSFIGSICETMRRW